MDALAWPVDAMPRIAVAGRFPLADRAHETRYLGVTHALHLHDYAGELRLGSAVIALTPGDVTISPAGVASTYRLDAPGQHWCVHFAGAMGADAVALPLHLPAGDRSGAVREGMAHVAALQARARDSRAAGAAARLSLQLMLLDLAERRAPEPLAAERAAAVIDARFAEPLDIPAIAAAVGRSPAHLARAFRARYGTTLALRRGRG